MNPDDPMTPREALEMRLTALLMGELPPADAAALQEQMTRDPQLAALHKRLAKAMELLREASAFPEQISPPTPVQLSSEKRERLLAQFKTAAPSSDAPAPSPIVQMRKRRDWSWVMPMSIAAGLIFLLGGSLLMPTLNLRVEEAYVESPEQLVAALPSSELLAEKSVRGAARQASPPQPSKLWRFDTAVPAAEMPAPSSPQPQDMPTILAKSGAGTLGLSDASRRGGDGAAMQAPGASASPPSNLPILGNLSATGGGVISGSGGFSNRDGLVPNQGTLNTTIGSGAWVLDGSNTFTGGTLSLNGGNTYSGGTTISGGEVTVKGGTLDPTIGRVGFWDDDETSKVNLNTTGDLATTGNSAERSKQLLTEAQSFYDTGRLDLARKRSQQILSLDQSNLAAQEMEKRVDRKMDDYGVAAYNSTRADAIKQTDLAWQRPIRRFNAPAEEDRISEQKPVAGKQNANDFDTGVADLPVAPTTPMAAPDAAGESGAKAGADKAGLDSRGRAIEGMESLEDARIAPLSMTADKLEADLEEMRQVAESVPKGNEPQRSEVEARMKSLEAELASVQLAMKGPPPAKQAPAAPSTAAGAEVLKREPQAVEHINITGNTRTKDKVIRREIAITPEEVYRKERSAAPSPAEPERLNKSVDELVAQTEAAKGVAAPAATSAGVAGAKNEPLTTTDRTTSSIAMASQAMTMPAIKSDKLAAPTTPAATPRPAAKPVEVAKLKEVKKELSDVQRGSQPQNNEQEVAQAAARSKTAAPAPVPQPEVAMSVNAFSTFSLNVSDVAFKLAGANLEKGLMPEPATVRSEEFINAFDYRDPEPAGGAPLAFVSERARYPFAQNRDLLRLSVKTAAAGRQPGRALNLVLLLDNSGSMERADRVRILREALRVLAAQLQPRDKLSVVTFARTPRLWADGVAGDKAGEAVTRVGEITPQGGTNLDAALDLGYATALRHYQVGSINRVVLLTDGAANLGDVSPDALKQKVESHRRQGVALDCFGIGWEGYDDSLLEALSRNGDGRYGFINSPQEAATEFAGQLAGALRVAASDVKVQVEFNPRRVTAYRQIGYAKHQLKKEQFRDNTVDAAEIGAAESGNALYVVEVNPLGEGDLATVRVRFKAPGTSDYHEHAWAVPFAGEALPLEQATPALRLAGTAGAFAEWLVASPYAGEVTTDRLLGLLNGVPANYGADPRPQKLEWMIRQAKSVSGR